MTRHPLTSAAGRRCVTRATAALLCAAVVASGAPLAHAQSSLSSSSSSFPGSSTRKDLPAPPRPADTQPATVRFGDQTRNAPEPEEEWVMANHPSVEHAEAYSPAMGTEVSMLVARPTDPAQRGGAPTLYLLNGLDGGTGWFAYTDAVDFYTSRGVNVVMVTSGAFSYYTNWIDGNQQWDTFLARELPAGLEPALGANGKRAVMGVSMSATSALSLAQNNPGVYDGIASISGCASTTSPLGRLAVDNVLTSNPTPTVFKDVWGDPAGPYAQAHDPMLNLGKLSPDYQGKDLGIFISTTSGLAGNESLTTGNIVDPGNMELALSFVTVGGPIDVGSNLCTHALHQRLLARGIAHDSRFYPQGTHNWNSFRWAVDDSWPTLSRALGKPAA